MRLPQPSLAINEGSVAQLLDAEESRRWRRLASCEDAQRFLAGRAFLRITLGAVLGVSPNVARARSQIAVAVPDNDYSNSGDLARGTALGEALFNQIIRVCDANTLGQHTRLIVLNTGFMKFMMPNNPTDAFYRDLPFFLAAHGLPFLDISGELAAASRDNLEDYVIPINRHPNEKGDALVAALIWPHLQVCCSS